MCGHQKYVGRKDAFLVKCMKKLRSWLTLNEHFDMNTCRIHVYHEKCVAFHQHYSGEGKKICLTPKKCLQCFHIIELLSSLYQLIHLDPLQGSLI